MLKIYLTDLAAYNKGYLLGQWITLPMIQEELEAALTKVLKQGEALCFMQTSYFEKHEEYFITDWEWEDTEVFKLGEYENIFELNSKIQTLEELRSDDLDVIAFLLNQGLACDIDDAVTKKDDVVIYYNSSMESIAYNLLEDCYDLDSIPNLIRNHIDYEGIAKELELEGNYYKSNGHIYEYIG